MWGNVLFFFVALPLTLIRWKLSNQPLLFDCVNCCLHLQSTNRHKHTSTHTRNSIKIHEEFIHREVCFGPFRLGNEKLHKNRARNVLPLLFEPNAQASSGHRCVVGNINNRKIHKKTLSERVQAHVTDRSQRETNMWTKQMVVVKPHVQLFCRSFDDLLSAALRTLCYAAATTASVASVRQNKGRLGKRPFALSLPYSLFLSLSHFHLFTVACFGCAMLMAPAPVPVYVARLCAYDIPFLNGNVERSVH